MAKLYNLARVTTATTGTGTITLGSAVSGYLTFAQAGVADGDSVDYAINDGANSEIGTGTYTLSGTTLTRSVTKSTNSNNAINLSGSAQVFISPRAETLADASSLTSGTLPAARLPTTATFTGSAPQITLGANATTLGSVKMFGNTSGDATIQPAAVAGTATVLTLPASTDTLVGRATTDTLTNKTLTSPTLTAPVLGTPASGTLTNCTGLPVAGISASTSTALGVGSIELGHASDTTLSRSAAGVLAVEGVIVKNVGTETIWIPASAMTSRATNGAASGTTEMTTNKNMFVTKDYDASTQEFCQFEVFFPKSWNLSTVTFRALWSHAATTTNFGVVWALQGIARSDDDAGDVAFGTEQTSTDTGGTTNDIYISPTSSAITIGGTPTSGDSVQFQIKRNPADASDTMAIDARLHGVQLFFTTNAATDA